MTKPFKSHLFLSKEISDTSHIVRRLRDVVNSNSKYAFKILQTGTWGKLLRDNLRSMQPRHKQGHLRNETVTLRRAKIKWRQYIAYHVYGILVQMTG